jgi:RNA polymerase sigma-70 factor (ECF subfamily)
MQGEIYLENIAYDDEFEEDKIDSKTNLDESSVIEAIAGCKDSFLKIINVNKEYLFKTAFLYVKNEHDASEVYQNTVYKAYISIYKLKSPQHFKIWITRILINNVHDAFRMTRRETVIEDAQQVEDLSYIADIEDKIDLYDAIDTLSYNYKTAVILRYFHDMSIKDISEIMNCSENTVKSYIHRAKRALLKNLKGE